MDKLKVSSKWLNWFVGNESELYSSFKNSEKFITEISGGFSDKVPNYGLLINMIELIQENFPFLLFDKIRLHYSEELEKYDLQICDSKKDFDSWKTGILNEFCHLPIQEEEIEDDTTIHINYSLNNDGTEEILYKSQQFDLIMITFWTDLQTQKSNYKISFELRQDLFLSANGENSLPTSLSSFNREVLENAMVGLKQEIEKLAL